MPQFVATFFTHYDAIVFNRALAALQIEGQMMPVPRKLSSSCGTCVSFSCDKDLLDKIPTDELERLVERIADSFCDLVDNR